MPWRSRLHLGRMRKLSPERQELLDTRLPDLRAPLGVRGALEPRSLSETPVEAVWLEIGFGAGEHLLHQARKHPERLHIGCEPYPAGVARLLADLGDIDNIRIHDGDASDLLLGLKSESIERIFLLFPDPWPKKRHSKRRMARKENLQEMARLLVDGGELRVATDSGAYAGWMLSNMRGCEEFIWHAEKAEDWRVPLEEHPATRYEEKARRAGRSVVYLNFEKRKC